MAYFLLFAPLSMFAVAFLLWLLSKIVNIRHRWLITISLATFLVLPSYLRISALAGKVYREDLPRLLLLQAIIIGLALIARQLRFSVKCITPFSKLRHTKLIPLIFVVGCIPVVWHIISSNGIITSYRTDTNLESQMPELLCGHILFLIFIISTKPAKWEG